MRTNKITRHKRTHITELYNDHGTHLQKKTVAREMKSKTIVLGTKGETMAVYGINNKMGPNEYVMFMREQFDKTGRAELINSKNNDDNLKWGHRVFNLTVAELMNKFDEKYDTSLKIVTKFFESEGLNVQSKHHFSKNMYDFPIKE